MSAPSLDRRFQDAVRDAGHTDTPIQAWPLMRRLGQLPPDVQELAIRQISSLLETFEILGTKLTAAERRAEAPQAHVAGITWEPGVN